MESKILHQEEIINNLNLANSELGEGIRAFEDELNRVKVKKMFKIILLDINKSNGVLFKKTNN